MACFDIPGDMMLTPDRRSIMLVTGAKRLKQRMRAGIGTLLGTYKYNTKAGIPWLTWFDKAQRVPIESELRKHLLSYPEVQSIKSLRLRVDKTTRMLFVVYDLQLRSGEEITDTLDIAQVLS